MWRNNKFLHNCQDFTILHICYVKKSEIPLHFSDFSPFAMYRNFSTWQIFLHMSHIWTMWQISGMDRRCAGNTAWTVSTAVHWTLYYTVKHHYHSYPLFGIWKQGSKIQMLGENSDTLGALSLKYCKNWECCPVPLKKWEKITNFPDKKKKLHPLLCNIFIWLKYSVELKNQAMCRS